MRTPGVALVLLASALPGRAGAQVDRGDAVRRAPNLDLPRQGVELAPTTADELRVPGAWRDIERDVGRAFTPAAEIVSTRPSATLLTKQLSHFFAVTRSIEEGHGDPAITMARDPQAELRRRFEEEPAEWMRTEIELDVSAQGEVQAVRVTASSGRRELDQKALRAVQQAVAHRHPTAAKGATTVRFAVDAGVVVTPPILGTAAGDPRNKGVTAGLRIRFDETTGKIDPLVPFARRVVTRVQVIDFQTTK
jgi:TonB family protein